MVGSTRNLTKSACFSGTASSTLTCVSSRRSVRALIRSRNAIASICDACGRKLLHGPRETPKRCTYPHKEGAHVVGTGRGSGSVQGHVSVALPQAHERDGVVCDGSAAAVARVKDTELH